jgi:2-dehydro-3-deoxygluconokinase
MRSSTKTVAFGELLLRLSPPGYERLLQSPTLHAWFGGGEANVAVSLARFGVDSQFVTRLPNNAIGDAALRALRAEGVNVDAVQRGGRRMGIYFEETGAGPRPSMVVYDREYSAVNELEPGAIRWPDVLRGTGWFHTSGITPALGTRAAECTMAALVAARASGARVSFDVNYRSTLWSEDEARRVLLPLLRHVDVLIANEWHLTGILGTQNAAASGSHLDTDALRAAVEHVVSEYGIAEVAITLRESLSASENGWSALLYDGRTQRLYRGRRYMVPMIDRIGAGDAFSAGLIFALQTGRSHESALELAIAAGALKHTIPGDWSCVSIAEVERLAAGDATGRVRR